MIAILAGNLQVFRVWQKENPTVEAMYIKSPTDAVCRTFTGYEILYGFWFRRDAVYIHEAVITRIRPNAVQGS